MSFLRGTEEYYRKFIELQEKLRKSEEERLKLEMKFNEMIHVTKEEDDAYHRRVQSQYKDFLHEDDKRQERNDRIVKVLERIENRAAVLAAKTEKFQLFRKQYMSYLRKVSNDVPYSHSHDNASIRSVSSMHSINDLKPSTPIDFEDKMNISEKHYYKPVPAFEPRPSTSENKYLNNYSTSTANHNADLYNHPIVRKALEQTNRNLNSDLEALKRYLSNRSPIEDIKPPCVLDDSSLSDSSDSNDIDLRYNEYKPRQEKVQARITKTIRWRPKFQMPRRHRFQYRTRSKWLVPDKIKYPPRTEYAPRNFCGTRTTIPDEPRREDVELFEPQSYSYQTPRYNAYGKTRSHRPISSNGFRDDDTDYLPRDYQAPSFSRYSKPTVSPVTDYNTRDLSYQLSNYPNLDQKNRLNIEYTVYPKISDVTPAQYSSPVDYHCKTDVSPSRSRVTWYDHYLGRCQPSDNYPYESSPQEVKNYKPPKKYESKIQQDNILLNPERRIEARSRTPSQYKTSRLTEPNGIIKNDFPLKPKKLDDDIDSTALYREEVSKPVVSFQNLSDHEELSKTDVQEYDSTEDQVPSEVLQDDIIVDTPSKDQYDFEDHVHSSDYRLKDEKYPDFEVEQYAVEPEQINDDEYFEEKHDSLQEIQKESFQEPLADLEESSYKLDDTNGQSEGNDDKEYQQHVEEETTGDNLESDLTKIQLNGESGIKDAFKVMSTDYDNKESTQEEDVDAENQLEHTEVTALSHQEDLTDGDLKYVEAQQEDDVVAKISPIEIKENPEIADEEPVVQENPDLPSQEENLAPQTDDPNVTTAYDTNAENPEYTEDQYDQTGQAVYDENPEQQQINYDENGQPIEYDNVQYDEHGQPIGYNDGQYYAQYDDNGQLIPQYDEHGQPIQQYDENGQPIQQYDENGQPVIQYDENGQPIVQYDENGQPIPMYDDNGQPIYQYDQYYQDQQYQEQQYQEPQYQEGQQQDPQHPEQYEESPQPQVEDQVGEVASEPSEKKETEVQQSNGTMKVMEMLDTDTESSKQDEQKTKVSNESDFDISSKK